MRPRLHAVVDATSVEQAVAMATSAFENAMDGVFLISHARDDGELVAAILAVRTAFPWGFLGANVIGRSPAESLLVLGEAGREGDVDALWTDSAGLDVSDIQRRAAAFAAAKKHVHWNGLHFGGVAFKYQPEVDNEGLEAMTEHAAEHVDVVTTSGAGTGKAIDLGKLITMATAASPKPLALASGVTPENVGEVQDHVRHILVSTGIKSKDGTFDARRIDALRHALG